MRDKGSLLVRSCACAIKLSVNPPPPIVTGAGGGVTLANGQMIVDRLFRRVELKIEPAHGDDPARAEYAEQVHGQANGLSFPEHDFG